MMHLLSTIPEARTGDLPCLHQMGCTEEALEVQTDCNIGLDLEMGLYWHRHRRKYLQRSRCC